MTYGVWLSDSASDSLLSLTERAYLAVSDSLSLLATMPALGRVYDPLYEAAVPPIPIRVLYSDNYGIYYTPDHERELIRVHFIEDQRMDPRVRFTGRG